MNNISPKAEPVAYATIVGLALTAVASYGIGITPELQEALVLIAPIIIAAIVARQSVWAPDSVEDIKHERYQAGRHKAITSPVYRTGPAPENE